MVSFIHRLLLSVGILIGEIFFFLIILFGVLPVIFNSASSLASGLMPACDMGAFSATAWLDQNANGTHDPDEPPLPDVCMWEAFRPEDYANNSICSSGVNKTNQNGEWQSSFYAGCPSGDFFIYIFALPPNGYKYTTPPVVRSNKGSFGFAPVETQTNIQIMPVTDYLKKDFERKATNAKIERVKMWLWIGSAAVIVFIFIWFAWKLAGKLVALK